MSKKLISTKDTEFAQNAKEFAIIDANFRAGKPIMISAEDLEQAFNSASAEDKQAFKDILTFDLEGEEISVTPTTSQQVKTPGTGKNAITKCTINAVTSSIDANITPANIKDGVTILGVTGTHKGGLVPVSWSELTKDKTLYFREEAVIDSQILNSLKQACDSHTDENNKTWYFPFSQQDNATYMPGGELLIGVWKSSGNYSITFYYTYDNTQIPNNEWWRAKKIEIATYIIYSGGVSLDHSRDCFGGCFLNSNTVENTAKSFKEVFEAIFGKVEQ